MPALPSRYEMLGELATGGMATVYLGRAMAQTSGAVRDVAIKSIRPELAQDESFLAMFLDEAALTSRIKHKNVVQTLELVSADGRLLIVMEYVDGVSLGRLLELAWRQRSAIPAAAAARILCDVLQGLHAAHELVDDAGRRLAVVHRDVSPQNVIVGVDGIARILDFGIAKATSQRHVTARGEIKGKLAYMPVEQQLGELVDQRADVYAAGVVLWELLTGRRLFSEPDEDKLVRQVFEGRVDPPSLWAEEELPAAVDHVVLRALARRREDRWWSADEMAKALAQALPPSSQSDLAILVNRLGAADLEARAQHIRKLQAAHAQLGAEEQIVLDLLTSDSRRRSLLDSAPPPPPVTAAPLGAPRPSRAVGAVVGTSLERAPALTPAHRTSAPPPPAAPSRPSLTPGAPAPAPVVAEPRSSRRARREERRRRRQLLLGGLVVVIVIATTLAFLVGRSLGSS